MVSKLENGGELWLLEDHDLPVVVFSLVLSGGSSEDAKDKLGTAELANQMLLEGAENEPLVRFRRIFMV